jgi:hypothetical protein
VRVVATLALVVMQVSAVAPAVAAVASQVAMIATRLVAIALQLVAVVARLPVAAVRAIATELTPVLATIAIVGTDVPAVVAEIPAVTAKIAAIGANVATVAADLARSLRAERLRIGGCLCARDRRSTSDKRRRQSKSNQFVAKHCKILQGSVGTRPLHRAVRGGRRSGKPGVKGFALPSVSRKRWYRSAPGWTDAIRQGEYVAVQGLTNK